MDWIYEGRTYCPPKDFTPKDYYGFVYVITNRALNKKYIGKKIFWRKKTLPPLKGKSIDSLYSAIDPLMEFKPAFVDVTYHREEFIERPRKEGGYDKVSIRKRPGTVAICAAIMNKYHLEAVPPLICGGFTKEETEKSLID